MVTSPGYSTEWRLEAMKKLSNFLQISVFQRKRCLLIVALLFLLVLPQSAIALTKPTLKSPSNNSTVKSTSCTFSWSHPYNDKYELKIKTKGGTLKYASGKTSSKSKTVDLAGIPLTAGSTYKWYVVVYANGKEDSSEDRWFTYDPPITKPTLNSPANNATLTSTSYTFSWSHPYNDQYELKIKTSGGTLKYASGKTSSKSKTVDLAGIPLTAGSTYKWYVVVYANGKEDSSEDRWFTYDPPITKPTLNSPANNATLTSTSCTFSWSHPYNDQYELKIKTSDGTLKYASGKTSSKSKTVDLAGIPLTAGSTYKWYVVVYANGKEDSSVDRWFKYDPPITKPTLNSPANNATLTSTSCTFSWSHPYNDQYELKIKTSGGTLKYASGKTSSKSKTVDLAGIPLTAGSTYKWYVVVYANGKEDSSVDRWFTYDPPITKPTLNSPANNATLTSTSYTFSWSHPYNDQYELKIKTSGGTLKYASGKTSSKSKTVDLAGIPLTAGSTYKWYVVVYANGKEDSSVDRWFTYDPPITKPTLNSPANNATLTSTSYTFSWSHPYNDQYELKIKTSGGTLKYASGKTSSKSKTVDLAGIPLTAGSTYKWYVVVYANGKEDSSVDRWFTYSGKTRLSIFSIGPYYPNGTEKYQDTSAESVNMINLWKCYSESKGYTFSSKVFNRHVNSSFSCNDILGMIQKQTNSLSGKDIFVFSFTGHGLKNELHMGYNGAKECVISASGLYEALKGLANKGVELVILLDACHSGSFTNELQRLGNPHEVQIFTSVGEDDKAWRICAPNGLWISAFNYAYYKILSEWNNLAACNPLVGSWEKVCQFYDMNDTANQYFSPLQDGLNQTSNWNEIATALADLNNMPELIGHYIYNQYGEEGVMTEEVWDPDYQAGTLPTVITTTVSAMTYKTAGSGGNITSEGGAAVTARGICWSTSANPTIVNSKTIDGKGTGTFTSTITGLSPQTNYYVRAYATNSLGTAYGDDVSFTTAYTAMIYVCRDGSCGDRPNCYTTIKNAIAAAPSGSIIMVANDVTYSGRFAVSGKSLTIQGGWNTSFGIHSGSTILQGTPSVSNGSVTMQDVHIVP